MGIEDKYIVCIVAAAGRGLRLGREMPKSFYPVEERPLLAHSLDSLMRWGGIDEFVVMVPAGWEEKAGEVVAECDGKATIRVVAGGETRQESVEIGLREAGEADIVVIHDGCRPFVSASLIDRVVLEAERSGAAVPVLQATDTLGRLRGEELETIVPRERIVSVQTPQAFRMDVLRKAYTTSEDVIRTSTDESSLVLAAGLPVRVVDGERWNIKVTVKDDIGISSSFLSECVLDMENSGEEG
ncbi:MAG: 2-C-methyl-D-erythritol 4-phosphate cytidylyltransferase [Bacteroidales bacterium]|nr:2-C-methyl-D-erythritol 4-phosphate cytidylyltransferase [Candidatus Latescibacterota bacterium]